MDNLLGTLLGETETVVCTAADHEEQRQCDSFVMSADMYFDHTRRWAVLPTKAVVCQPCGHHILEAPTCLIVHFHEACSCQEGPFCSYVLQEQGYNGLHMNQVVNGWIRSVTVKNSDMGIYLWGCVFTTIENVTLTNTYPRGWFNGHRGIWLEHGSDTIVKK